MNAENTYSSSLNSGHCLSTVALRQYIDGTLPKTRIHTVEKHLLDCDFCSSVLEDMDVSEEGRTTVESIVENVNKRILKMVGPLPRPSLWTAYRNYFLIGGGALILFGLSHTLWLSLVLMVFVGFGLLQGASASNTIIQSLVPEDKRARAMGYYTMAFFGAAPFGSLLAGALANRIGAPHTVFVTGAFCLAGSLWFTLELPKVNAVIRPIYQEMGLLPARDIGLTRDEREPSIGPLERKNHHELV